MTLSVVSASRAGKSVVSAGRPVELTRELTDLDEAEQLTRTSVGEGAAREHLADYADGGGASLLAVRDHGVIGIVTIRWQSNYPGFRDHGIPLVHQLAVVGPCRRLGAATLLMDAAEDLARRRGIAELGITVRLSGKYGARPAALRPARLRSGWPGSTPRPDAAERRSEDDH